MAKTRRHWIPGREFYIQEAILALAACPSPIHAVESSAGKFIPGAINTGFGTRRNFSLRKTVRLPMRIGSRRPVIEVASPGMNTGSRFCDEAQTDPVQSGMSDIFTGS